MCIRLYHLNQVPRDVLEERLGYDIPPLPEFSIASVRSRSITLLWLNARDASFTSISLSLVVNGVKLGQINHGESSIEILNLRPGQCYTIKVQVLSNPNLTSTIPAICVQTLTVGDIDSTDSSMTETCVTLRTSTSISSSTTIQSSGKDSLRIASHGGKVQSARRALIPANSIASELESDTNADDDLMHSKTHLSDQLEVLKKQRGDIETSIEDEEHEAKLFCNTQIAERDALRQELKEREERSAEIKKQANVLDKQNRSAQSKRAAKEKLLLQKLTEAKKRKDDTERWQTDVHVFATGIETTSQQLQDIELEKAQNMHDSKRSINENHELVKGLEESIRLIGPQIKQFEQQQEQLRSTKHEAEGQEGLVGEDDQTWESKYHAMHMQLSNMWMTLQQAQNEERAAEEKVAWYLEEHARRSENSGVLPFPDNIASRSYVHSHPRRTRHADSRNSNVSVHSQIGAKSNLSKGGPIFSTGSSAIVEDTSAMGNVSDDADASQNGGLVLDSRFLMSPAADDLLPSNLFRDDDMSPLRTPILSTDLSRLNGLVRHAATTSDASAQDPATPVSVSSIGGSILTSPGSSAPNLQHSQHQSDPQLSHVTDSYPPILHSADITSQPSNKLSNIFSSPFGRPRGKTGGAEPPLLGALKQGQSQSFPRKLEQDFIDANNGVRPRRGSYGSWAKPMSGLLMKSNADDHGQGLIRARTGSGRSSRLNVFKHKIDSSDLGIDTDNESSISRPSSTYSFDQIYSRASYDGQSIWATQADGISSRIHPMGISQWAPPSSLWSKVPSRRSSIHHGSSATNLSLGSTPLIAEEIPGKVSNLRPEQAPIGTRPQSRRTVTPKLNPTAPTFKTIFGRSEARKGPKTNKSNNKAGDLIKDAENERNGTDGTESVEDTSAQNPRHSRDAQSIMTSASTTDSHDSMERTLSGSNNENSASSGQRESLMRKITRKGSSSKFNVPWSKDRGIFSKRSAAESINSDQLDEGNASDGLSSSKGIEGTSSTPTTPQEKHGRSWPSMRRKSRKGSEAFGKGTAEFNGEDE